MFVAANHATMGIFALYLTTSKLTIDGILVRCTKYIWFSSKLGIVQIGQTIILSNDVVYGKALLNQLTTSIPWFVMTNYRYETFKWSNILSSKESFQIHTIELYLCLINFMSCGGQLAKSILAKGEVMKEYDS